MQELEKSQSEGAWFQMPLRSWLCFPVLTGIFAVLPYITLLLTGDLVLKNCEYSDYESYQLPVREFAQQELLAGRFPLWNPYLACGIPVHATGQVGLTYPLLTPFLFVFDVNRAIKLSLFLHVVLCYWGQYRLGRFLGLSEHAAALSGLVATQGGFLTSHLAVGHLMHVFAYSLLPWLFLRTCEVCRQPNWTSLRHFATIVAVLLLIGHPQLPYYGLLFAGLWTCGSMLAGDASRHRFRCAMVFSVAFGIAFLVAAIQLVPTFELIRDNANTASRGSLEYAGAYGLDGLDLYRLLIPSLRGVPLTNGPEFMPPDFYHEKVSYLGLFTWLLMTLGLYAQYDRNWPWGAAMLVGLGIAIGLGQSTVLFGGIGTVVPGMFLFRCPGRCLAVVSILAALLAGRGFDALLQTNSTVSRHTSQAVTWFLIMAATLATAVIDRSVSRIDLNKWVEFAEHNLKAELHASALMLVGAICATIYLPRVPRNQAALWAIGLLVVDLGYFNLRGIQFDERQQLEAPPEALLSGDLYRFIDAHRESGFSSSEVRYSRLVPLAVRQHLRMVGTNEGGLLPAGCEKIFDALEGNSASVLRVSGCHLLSRRTESLNWRPVEGARPRIRIATDAEAAAITRPIASLTAVSTNSHASTRHEHITVIEDSPQRILVEVDVDCDRPLLVADIFYPGWVCEVDGEAETMVPAYGCFRSVRLTRGAHRVDMSYRPQSFVLGRILSLIGITILVAIAAGQRLFFRLKPS